MSNKAFIARDNSGMCFIMSEKPVCRNGIYYGSGGSIAELRTTVASLLGIPFPNPGEMIEWSPPLPTTEPEPVQTEVEMRDCRNCGHSEDGIKCAVSDGIECYGNKTFRSWVPRKKTEPEPPAETLEPITTSLKVGDVLRNGKKCFPDLCVKGFDELLIYTAVKDDETIEDYWTIHLLIACGYQQVVTAPRTISRAEARKAMMAGNTVRDVGRDVWYRLNHAKDYVVSGNALVQRWSANINVFDIPEGRYEIVGGE